MSYKLKIIFGATRKGRVGLPVARWAEQFIKEDGRFDVEFVDLAELDLPLMDEPNHPRFKKYEHEHTKRWSRIADEADAFVFVTPEYDYFVPASIVNAIQYLSKEWNTKPAAVVSYGGVSGGLRSTQELRMLLCNVGVVPMVPSVPIPFFATHIDETGVFNPVDATLKGMHGLLNELMRWTKGLKAMRDSAA